MSESVSQKIVERRKYEDVPNTWNIDGVIMIDKTKEHHDIPKSLNNY